MRRSTHFRFVNVTTLQVGDRNMAVCKVEERVANPTFRWYFGKEELERSPSRNHGVDFDKEMSYRQMTATMIQDMGRRLKL